MKTFFNTLTQNKTFVVITTFFLILYSLLSLVNHYNFRSNAWDLGIFNQAIYQYAHLQLGSNTISEAPNLLADHFDVVMILFSPFYRVFGSYTLLLFQIIMAFFGAVGVYIFLNEKTNDRLLSLGGTIIFYSFYGIFSAILY